LLRAKDINLLQKHIPINLVRHAAAPNPLSPLVALNAYLITSEAREYGSMAKNTRNNRGSSLSLAGRVNAPQSILSLGGWIAKIC
jgi:hypothetical protein